MFGLNPLIDILMERIEQEGGLDVNYQSAQAFNVLTGIELLYFRENAPAQAEIANSNLCDKSDSIIFSICMENDFCFVLSPGKKMPVFFARYLCDMSVVLNIPLINAEDFQWLSDIDTIINRISEKFYKEEQFCVIKVSSEIKEVFSEMLQVPLPPNRFKFYMQLKVAELMLLLSDFNVYSSLVHFYPYCPPPKGGSMKNFS